ncbi:MAG: DinB family protein [Chloroflexota bacterium]
MTGDVAGSIRPFYADWAGYNRRTIDGLAALDPDALALQPPGSEHWPIWAIAAHTAGTRIFWLCEVFGEPGADRMSFYQAGGMGWEDDPSTPRTAAEITGALRSSWSVVEGCLDGWTPAMLEDQFERVSGSGRQLHTRQSILLRMINHEAYHLGEINIALGANGREPIDPWPGADWAADAPRSLREGP